MPRFPSSNAPPHLSVATGSAALLVGLAAGCAGEAIEPGRSANHPANPATTEAPFVAPPSALGGDAPPAAARPAPSGASAMPGGHVHGAPVPGADMAGMDMQGMQGTSRAGDGGAKIEPGKAK